MVSLLITASPRAILTQKYLYLTLSKWTNMRVYTGMEGHMRTNIFSLVWIRRITQERKSLLYHDVVKRKMAPRIKRYSMVWSLSEIRSPRKDYR